VTSAQTAVERWFRAALATVDPEEAVGRMLKRDGRRLVIDGRPEGIAGKVWVVAVGKAALPMARAVERECDELLAGGVVITKDGISRASRPSDWRCSRRPIRSPMSEECWPPGEPLRCWSGR
jgi:glycerate-2-kinase